MNRTFTMLARMCVSGVVLAAVLGVGLIGSGIGTAAQAAGAGVEIERRDWTFGGLFGYYDRAQMRRGYKVYKQVCASCHGMKLLYYRNLGEPGGPEFSEAKVKEIAAEAVVLDGPNDVGEMFERPGRPSDHIVGPFKNDKEAAAANNGAVPPDLSVIAKARGLPASAAWYMEPLHWLRDIATVYQEQGPDYIYALLTGYTDAPEGVEMAPGMFYNKVFPGHQIAMPPPLSDEIVEYEDGTPPTVANYAADVSAFLMWAAEPTLEERKKMGVKVLVYLIVLSVLLYLSKRLLWSRVKH